MALIEFFTFFLAKTGTSSSAPQSTRSCFTWKKVIVAAIVVIRVSPWRPSCLLPPQAPWVCCRAASDIGSASSSPAPPPASSPSPPSSSVRQHSAKDWKKERKSNLKIFRSLLLPLHQVHQQVGQLVPLVFHHLRLKLNLQFDVWSEGKLRLVQWYS